MTRKHPFAPTLNRRRSRESNLITVHNGRGITSFRPQRRGRLAVVFDGLALASTALGLAILWHTGVLGA